MTKPTLKTQKILEIEPYLPGASKVKGKSDVIKLSSNENAFGPSPKAIEAIKKAAISAHLYPDGTSAAVREAIAGVYGLDAGRIVCGAGSDELIGLLCAAFGGEGKEVLYSKHGFLMYPIYAKISGATPVTADEVNLKADVDQLLKKVTNKTAMVCIANPNNPTGSYITKEELLRLRKELPAQVLLVLDMAYAEYVDAADYPDADFVVKNLVDAGDNTVMLRTFSKIYGLASLRLGWAYASNYMVDILHRVRSPFNVSAIAQTAGVAAIQDQEFIKKSRAHNISWRKKMSDALQKAGLKVYPSQGNFILVEFSTEEGRNAAAADAYLKENGIIVRKMDAYGLPKCLRITIGQENENITVTEVLRNFLKG